MNIEISGRNYDVSDKIRNLITSKLEKIRKYFVDIIEIRCVLKVEKKYRHICEIHVHGKDYDIASTQEAEAMADAIQSTIDHLKRQAQKNRTKIRDHRKGRTTGAEAPSDWLVSVLEPGNLREEDATPRIVKTSTLPIRPMSIEQAALTLDDSKNEFIVFRNLDTDQVTVIYKRNDSNFGMISPEF